MTPMVALFAWLTAEPSGALDVSVFAQYGVLGILAGMLIWFAKGAHQREKDRSDRLEDEVKRLHELMLDRVIPALTSAAAAAEQSAALLNTLQREREISNLAEVQRRHAKGGEG